MMINKTPYVMSLQ